jgi:hypothetical protein
VVQSAIVAPKSSGAFNNPTIFTVAADDFTTAADDFGAAADDFGAAADDFVAAADDFVTAAGWPESY